MEARTGAIESVSVEAAPASSVLMRPLMVRAIVALGLLFGFYLCVVGVAAAILAIPFVVQSFTGSFSLFLLGLCVLSSASVLIGLVPALTTPFEAPGPEITEAEQPALFALLRDVAARMGQRMPANVYVVPDVTAFAIGVGGGVLGIGSKRVIGIGMCLLAVANVSQLRAVIAHELGHFASGDMRLGETIHATRLAMLRTIENLRWNPRAHLRMLAVPFSWMLDGYMRITQAISRQQELVADEWAARIAGTTAQATALEQLAVHDDAFALFLEREVLPLFERQLAFENVFEGYRRFWSSSAWHQAQPEIRRRLLHKQKTPYDSHPSEAERIRYLYALPLGDVPVDPTPARGLLDSPHDLEAHITAAFFRPGGARTIDWSNTGEGHGDTQQEEAEGIQARMGPEFDVRAALAALEDESLRMRLVETVIPPLVGYYMPDRAGVMKDTSIDVLASYLGAQLVCRGYDWRKQPGEPLLLVLDSHRIDLRGMIEHELERRAPAGQVRALLESARIPLHSRLELAPDRCRELLRRRAEVSCEPRTASHTVVYGRLSTMEFPRCCCVCRGMAEAVIPVELDLHDMHNETHGTIGVNVAVCPVHRQHANRALAVHSYSDRTDMIVLHVADPTYAALIERVNR